MTAHQFSRPIPHDAPWFEARSLTDALGRTRTYASTADRVRAAVIVDDATGCWVWQRCHNPAGYGSVADRGATYLAHRLAYAIWRGDVPADALVCHHCDNPPCCNPEHLYLGDHQDNVNDMVTRGRQVAPTGLSNGRAKLGGVDVEAIRTAVAGGESRKAVGRRLGLHPSYVGRIVSGIRRAA